MKNHQDIDVVFFDIGGTLGERHLTTGLFKSFPSSAGLLKAMREVVGLRIGVITTLGPGLTNTEGLALLQGAGLAQFLDPQGFVSDHDAGVAKPHVAIYQVAAQRVGVPIGRCLYVGENLSEVLGALVAGMKAVLKPSPPGREVSS
jgi:FMN phosphatase YigB (HAD superfamily)